MINIDCVLSEVFLPRRFDFVVISCSIAEKSDAKLSTALCGKIKLSSRPCLRAFSAFGTCEFTSLPIACSLPTPSKTNVKWYPIPKNFDNKRLHIRFSQNRGGGEQKLLS